MDKRIRYGTRIFMLDRINQNIGGFIWDKDDLEYILKENEKHYGLKLISEDKKVFIIMEYSNIIWNYKIYFGSYKKRYNELTKDDERWITIETDLAQDLKTMGLDMLKNEILIHLKDNKYFEYQNKVEEQFRKYCI